MESSGVREWDAIVQDVGERRITVLNSLANRQTAAQRAARGWVLPWNRTAPPKRTNEEELPEAECSWAPWSYS
ncbi:hypothetical protein ACWGDE_07595 [Streptomyces sp. NPDC054956]